MKLKNIARIAAISLAFAATEFAAIHGTIKVTQNVIGDMFHESYLSKNAYKRGGGAQMKPRLRVQKVVFGMKTEFPQSM